MTFEFAFIYAARFFDGTDTGGGPASSSACSASPSQLPANSEPARATPVVKLEPISKSSEEDHEAGELYKAEEVLSVVLPADEDATLPLYPGEEALDQPAPHVAA